MYKTIKERKKHTSYGARVWLTKDQLIKKYDSVSIAEAIIASKLVDEETKRTQTKEHPDCPGNEAWMSSHYVLRVLNACAHACSPMQSPQAC